MPGAVSFGPEQKVYLSGARGDDPGGYMDIAHQAVVLRVFNGPSAGSYLVPANFKTGSVVSFINRVIPMTNYNVSVGVSLWYDNYGYSNEANLTVGAFIHLPPTSMKYSHKMICRHFLTSNFVVQRHQSTSNGVNLTLILVQHLESTFMANILSTIVTFWLVSASMTECNTPSQYFLLARRSLGCNCFHTMFPCFGQG